jgi:hypothetical protein
MAWSIVSFGKHKGKTLPQIVFSDPDWFFWATEDGIFKGPLRSEANLVNARAKSIRIPNNANGTLAAEYLVHQPTGKFAGMDIVPTSQPLHQGSSPAFRKQVIDLSTARSIAPYDKLGCKNLISAAKQALFGNRSARLSQQKCELFFDTPSNFV